MPRDVTQYLRDILQAIRDIEQYTAGAKDFDAFSSDAMRIHAILYNLEIIGEAVKNIPATMKKKYSYVNDERWQDYVIFWHMNILASHWRLYGESSRTTYPLSKNKSRVF